jgi:hypothetical protein
MDSASVGPARGCTFVNSAVIATSLPMEVKILLDRRFREQTEESQREVELQDGSKSELPRTLNVLCRESVESEAASNYVINVAAGSANLHTTMSNADTSHARVQITASFKIRCEHSAEEQQVPGHEARAKGRYMERDDELYHAVTRTIRDRLAALPCCNPHHGTPSRGGRLTRADN